MTKTRRVRLRARTSSMLAQFGLTPLDVARTRRGIENDARRVLARCRPGTITLITGPSGSGKSTLLRRVVAHARRRGLRVISTGHMLTARVNRGRVGEALHSGLDAASAMATLAAAGLGEAGLIARPVRLLSVGERARLALAMSMSRAARSGSKCLIVCDEFCSGLDEWTARSLGISLRRWVDRLDQRVAPALLLAGAAAHGHLPADTLVRLRDDGVCEIGASRRRRCASGLRVAPGDIRDYDALANLHYRAGRPATLARILAARTRDGELAGVLVVSMPTLNGRWRELAWPGRYSGDRRRAAARLNRELRCISRVIVAPRFRGAGVATRLIRAYLARPLTPATEAVAAMGAATPMFRRAGMREYRLAPSARDARLIDALAARGHPPEVLLESSRASRLVARDALLRRELRRWAGASRATKRLRSTRARLRAAAGSVACAQTAYATFTGRS